MSFGFTVKGQAIVTDKNLIVGKYPSLFTRTGQDQVKQVGSRFASEHSLLWFPMKQFMSSLSGTGILSLLKF